MAATDFISGRYTAVWNSLACGQSREGFRISHQFMKKLIMGDAMGETPQDAILRGMEVLVQADLMHANQAAIGTMLNPYGDGYAFDPLKIGQLDVQNGFAKAFILTAVNTGTGAPVPASQTLLKAVIQENFPVGLLFAPDLREVPVRLRAYPAANGSFVSAS